MAPPTRLLSKRLWPIASILLSVVFGRAPAFSQNSASTSPPDSKAGKKANKNPLPEFTAEREAAALTFVRRSHPELLPLLEQLKKKSKKGYEDAIGELFARTEELALLRQKDPRQYEIALEIWILQSRASLLASRIGPDGDPEVEKKLRELYARNSELDIERKKLEREKIANRLAKIDADIDRLSTHRNEVIDAKMKRVRDIANRKRPNKNSINNRKINQPTSGK